MVLIDRDSYSSGHDASDALFAEHLRLQLEDVFYKFHVDLVFTGHYHNYERTCTVYKEKCVPGAPVHILVGTAGIELGNEWNHPKPPWSAKRCREVYGVSVFLSGCRFAEYGHGLVTAYNATLLQFDFVRCSDGQVLDTVRLTK